MAEQTVYESLASYIGNTDGVDCFRGYMPINADGNPERANVWMISSGGSADAFNIDRTYGDNGAWCNELIKAEIVGLFENRTTAMNFTGSVLAWLKSTSNLKETGNVSWCHLADLPGPPQEDIILNHRYWRVTIPLEILFLTEGTH